MKKLKKTAFLVLLTCTLTKLTANDDASDLSQWTGLKNCFAEFLKQESYYTDTKKSFSQKTYEDLLSILNNRTKFVKKLVEDPTTFQRSSYILLMEWLTAFDYLNNTQFKDFFEEEKNYNELDALHDQIGKIIDPEAFQEKKQD